MNGKTNTGIRLGPRDRAILRHVARFRMTTIDALHRTFFAGKRRDAVKSTVRRLCGRARRDGYLHAEPLDARRVYYRLTSRATNLLGLGKDHARPLGLQARIRRYAVLWLLCIEESADRVPMTPRDFPEQFGVAGHRLPRAHFYIEERHGGETRLGYAVVDHGRHPRRIYRNVARTLQRFLRHGWLDEFIAAGAFDVAVLTVSEPKRRSLQRGLEPYLRKVLEPDLSRFGFRRGDPLPLMLSVRVVPGLLEILPDPIDDRRA